jgi:hypothetical protein
MDGEIRWCGVDRSGVEHPTAVTGEAFSMPRLAPDLQRVAIASGAGFGNVGQGGDLWIHDLLRETRRRLTFEPNTANDIWVLTFGPQSAWRPFVQTKFREGAPTFSHDSRLIAYVSDQSGRSEIYVRPFPGPGEAVTVSTNGGSEPAFARNAPTLFYRRDEEMFAVDIAAGPPIDVGPTRRVFEKPYNKGDGFWPNYDVTPDGRRLLMIRGTAQEVSGRVNVVLNWREAKQ